MKLSRKRRKLAKKWLAWYFPLRNPKGWTCVKAGGFKYESSPTILPWPLPKASGAW